MATESQAVKEASYYDTLRVLLGVITPTLAKGVIKRRPSAEFLAQHQGLDTKAMQLLQSLRKKYGAGPLLLSFPFRPQVLVLDPKDVAQVLDDTPVPFTSATKEKQSALSHFEPGNILISDPDRRAQLRPVHENALATNERVHPFADRFRTVVNEELEELFPQEEDKAEFEVNWLQFSECWFRIIRRIVLGDAARNDEELTGDLDTIRKQGNWGFAAPTIHSKLESFQERLRPYLATREEGSLVSRLPQDHGLDLESQVAHWMFAFEPAGMAAFRALALLGCHSDHQAKAFEGSKVASADHPYSRAVVVESLRLWPTTPVILRELTKDHPIGNHMVKKGTHVIIFAPFFHRDDQRLSFAHQMHPSTFFSTELDSENALVPFSAGPAMCPAHNMVPLVTSLAVDALVSKAEISLAKPSMDPQKLPGTLDHFEIKLRLKKRSTIPS